MSSQNFNMNSTANITGGAKASFRPPALGGASLLVIFAVLCLTVFALLSLSTVQADIRLADASTQAVIDYYEADAAAEAILARLRGGQVPEGVEQSDGNVYSYSLSIDAGDTQSLEVSVRIVDANNWQVLRWQAVPNGDWEYDDSLNLWDGGEF